METVTLKFKIDNSGTSRKLRRKKVILPQKDSCDGKREDGDY